jgi:hypothetical protein
MPGMFNNRYYDPSVGEAIGNLAGLFAPPSPQALAAYAMARSKNGEADRLSNLYAAAQDAGMDQGQFDRMGQAAGQWTPKTGYYGVDADNKREAVTSLYGALNPGQIRPAVPENVAGLIGLPGIDQRTGAPENLTDSQTKGAILRSLPENEQRDIVRSGADVEVIMRDGQPVVVPRGQSWGQAPAPKAPGTVVNVGPNGEEFGKAPEGTVWQRDETGKVKLDERGAPVAIPFQGGPVWEKQQSQGGKEASAAERQARQGGVVAQDIDRALDIVSGSPMLTTGMGAQMLSGVGGTSAKNVAALLDAVKANVGFDQLQAMRAASPTGGALGAVSEQENKLLQSALGSLDQSQDQKQLTDNLKRVKNIYLDIVHGVGNGPPRVKLSYSSQWDQAGAPAAPNAAPAAPNAAPAAAPTAINPATGERVVLQNGQWVPVK